MGRSLKLTQSVKIIIVSGISFHAVVQWDNQHQKWQKIGEVVDAVGSSRKQLFQGKEYDYVFDVDIHDNAPPLKLPYNASGNSFSTYWNVLIYTRETENPYNAAQRFLQSNDLPMTYLDEVVKFIEKNTSGVNIGAGGEEYVDPFTGLFLLPFSFVESRAELFFHIQALRGTGHPLHLVVEMVITRIRSQVRHGMSLLQEVALPPYLGVIPEWGISIRLSFLSRLRLL